MECAIRSADCESRSVDSRIDAVAGNEISTFECQIRSVVCEIRLAH